MTLPAGYASYLCNTGTRTMSQSHPIRLLALLLITVTACSRLVAQDSAPSRPDSPGRVFWFKTPIPLGTDAFVLRPADRKFYLLSCIEDNRFNSLRISRLPAAESVVDRSGGAWQQFPDQVTFRVTATAKEDDFKEVEAENIIESGDLNSFMLGLQFRLKAYRGLTMTVLQPARIAVIGVPADLPSDYRIFRITFDTKGISVDTRLVLEVLSPGGQLLSRFHLELL